ncbi:hypothetical protein chiPu_0022931, partial [Chiloscyllium punctatum]|nr:hypothetical protein [Chiloscyllium punctatum]
RKIPPSFTKKPLEKIQDTEGKAVKLEGRLSGSQPISVTWFKNDQEILQTENYELSFKNNVVVLNIKKAHPTDSAVYTCKASNEAGTAMFTVSLLITELLKPPVCDIPLKPMTLTEGESLQLSCHVHGSKPINIQWFKDRKEMMPSERLNFTFKDGTATLECKTCTKTDSGDYLCKATNEAGTVSCKAKITVQEKAVPKKVVSAPKTDKIFFIEKPQSVKVTESKCGIDISSHVF